MNLSKFVLWLTWIWYPNLFNKRPLKCFPKFENTLYLISRQTAKIKNLLILSMCLTAKKRFCKNKKGSQFGLTYLDVIKNVTWKASSQLNLFCKYILGEKGRRKSVPKFFLGKREGSIRWSLSDEVWTATCKDSYHYRVGPINNINETPSNTPISMWDSLEVSRQLFLHHFCCQEML